MKRVLLAITVGLTVFGMVLGLAAGMNVGADQLGSGTSAVGACDLDGVTVSFGLAAGNVTEVSEVTVAGIDAACEGQSMSVQLTGDTGDLLTETVTVQAGGGSQVVPLTSTVAAASITGVNVTITG